MKMYSEDEMLMLSGIQHIAFCERQWALIHIEQQWKENVLTVEGQFLHERTDDPFETVKRKNIITLRAIPVASGELGLSGRADVIELIMADSEDLDSISLPEYSGRWKVCPVEYKRGKPKPDICDEVQLCAQAMCIEEKHGIHIKNGYLFYGKTHHRHDVIFDENLRNDVERYAARMHELFSKGITPAPDHKTHCKSCSLYDLCMPRSLKKINSASEYISKNLLIN